MSNKVFGCAVILDPEMPFAPHPPAPSPYHIAAGYQWFELESSDWYGGPATGLAGPWTIRTGDRVVFLILDLENRLGQHPAIKLEFSYTDGRAGSPFSSGTTFRFSPRENMKYGGRSRIQGYYTAPAMVQNTGRYAFTVSVDGAEDFYLDPEMDIGS